MRVYYIPLLMLVFLILSSQFLAAGDSDSPVDQEVISAKSDCRISFSSGVICAQNFSRISLENAVQNVKYKVRDCDFKQHTIMAFLIGAHIYLATRSRTLLTPEYYETCLKDLPFELHEINITSGQNLATARSRK